MRRIGRVDALAHRLRLHEMIQLPNELGGELGLGAPRIAFGEQRLAVEIGQLDRIIIDYGDLADARTGERRNDRAADPARSDDRDFRRFELALPDSAELRQDDVPRVPVELFVGEAHRPVEPKPPAPRDVSPNSATSRKSALSTGAGTSCAIRSPRRTSKASLPRLARITFTSPR